MRECAERHYRVATISRLLKNIRLFCDNIVSFIGLFCKRDQCDRHSALRDTTRWLRLVGSFKSSVSFVKYSLFYRALLQKRPILLRSLLIVATPYPFAGEHYPDKSHFLQKSPTLIRVSFAQKSITRMKVSFGKEPYIDEDLFCKRVLR